MLRARILRIGLDQLERGLRADALDLELGDERGELAGRVADDRHGALGREEVEAREVADVVRAEEREPGQAEAANVLQQALATRLQLRRRDPDSHVHVCSLSDRLAALLRRLRLPGPLQQLRRQDRLRGRSCASRPIAGTG